MVSEGGTVDLVIRGGTVLPGGARPAVTADVSVSDGRVVAVGDTVGAAREEIDASGMLVIPGLNNLHDHLRDMTPGLDLAEGKRLDEILRIYWELSEAAGPDEYRAATALGSLRLLKAGVTSVVDHVYPFHRPGLGSALVEGYETVGIRWFLARGIMTRGYPPICESSDAAFAATAELVAEVGAHRVLVAPVSFRQAEPDDYRRARALADELGVRLYTHVAETDAEVEMTLAAHGRRPVELLGDLGFTGPDTVLVHCVLLTDDEVALLAASGTHVVHCPSNHMRLAKGNTRVVDLADAGVNVTLGVDQMVDLFREMRNEVLMQSLHRRDPGALAPSTAFAMATEHGARALGGVPGGVIEVGRPADLVCLDVSNERHQPMLDPVWSLVHRSEGSDVGHVVVDGEVVVRDRRLTRCDEASVIGEAMAVVDRYLERVGLPDRHRMRRAT